MRMFLRVARMCVVLSITFLLSYCDEESNPTQTLPTGCQMQGVYGLAVPASDIACFSTNAFADPSKALGSPDGRKTGDGKLEFDGFVSLGVEGSITLFMGSCIQDLAGPDLRVFQTVSEEPVEVLVSANEAGPFISLGIQACDDICDFDLAGSGLNNIRFVRVFDRSHTQFPASQCDNVGPSPGADLDSVQVLH